MMICYKKVNGRASDVRFVKDDYTPQASEVLLPDGPLPTAESLSDPGSAPQPVDQSDLDNMEKGIKVAILLTRKWCNEILAGTYTQKTVAQTKAEAKAIWDALQ